jgi:hypothetical protein
MGLSELARRWSIAAYICVSLHIHTFTSHTFGAVRQRA